MISQKLVELIENDADKLTKRWLADVQKRPETPTYHTFDPNKNSTTVRTGSTAISESGFLTRRIRRRLPHIIPRWELSAGKKIALSEVIQALITTRRYLWLKVLSDGLLDTALDLHKGLDLNNRVVSSTEQFITLQRGMKRKKNDPPQRYAPHRSNRL